MFSGLIGYRGTVVSVDPLLSGGATLRVRCEGVEREAPEIKDSIAVDGVCLTATTIKGDVISFDVIPETLARSTLGERRAGDRVNLEYSLRVGDRMGGHFVYGHVDATARVLARAVEGQGERVRIERAREFAAAIVEKAFVAIDGVSLTVAQAGDDWFELALIPETLSRTTLGARPVGSAVNIEVDPLARYVAAALRLVFDGAQTDIAQRDTSQHADSLRNRVLDQHVEAAALDEGAGRDTLRRADPLRDRLPGQHAASPGFDASVGRDTVQTERDGAQ